MLCPPTWKLPHILEGVLEDSTAWLVARQQITHLKQGRKSPLGQCQLIICVWARIVWIFR